MSRKKSVRNYGLLALAGAVVVIGILVYSLYQRTVTSSQAGKPPWYDQVRNQKKACIQTCKQGFSAQTSKEQKQNCYAQCAQEAINLMRQLQGQ